MRSYQRLFAAALAFIFVFSAFILFLTLCWSAAADAQGAIAFFIYAPILAILIIISFFIGKYTSKTYALGRFSKRTSLILGIFFMMFYISPFIGFHSLSDGIIRLVANSFKVVTGKTPLQWDKNL